jgi:uncharacterized hydrophobic protein (TIGR00271 family)
MYSPGMTEEGRSTLEPGFIHRRLNFPLLEREDRVSLAERVRSASSADADFVMMMTLAAVLASLGLMQGSTAVVIGAMLVAPLMGPLLGAGLSVTQGNLKLFRDSFVSIALGVGIGFGVSLIVGLLNPGYEPSLEIEARGNPDVLDLGIALASGMVAAYAQGRPNVASTLAGVAIAAALVPPLAVVGVALTVGRPIIAGNAAILLMTNLVAITLGAGLVFRMLGVRIAKAEEGGPAWARRAVILLVMGAMLLSAPLFLNMLKQKQQGQDRPLIYPVSPEVRDAMYSYVAEHPGLEVITMARSSVEPDRGIAILLESDREVAPELIREVQTLVQQARGEAVPVPVHVLRSARTTSSDPELP